MIGYLEHARERENTKMSASVKPFETGLTICFSETQVHDTLLVKE